MKFIFRLLFILGCSFLFSSCEKTFSTIIDIDIPHTPIIALECLNIENGTFASITSTVSVTGTTNPSSINNAKAILYENNQFVDSFVFDIHGGYMAPFSQYKGGIGYKVVVSAPTFETIEAEDVFPIQTDIVKTEFTKNAKSITLDGGGFPQMYDEFKITFRNDINQNDYYKFNLTNSLGDQSIYIVSNDIDIDPKDDPDPLSGNHAAIYQPFNMSDLNFNGKEKTFTFYSLSSATDQINTFWILSISHLSEGFYKYEKTRRLYEDNQGNPFAEPVQIYSNVKNGVGIFALKNDTLLTY